MNTDRYLHAQDVAGAWTLEKFRRQSVESSIFQAARNLRKQGAPIGVVLAMARSLAMLRARGNELENMRGPRDCPNCGVAGVAIAMLLDGNMYRCENPDCKNIERWCVQERNPNRKDPENTEEVDEDA